MAEDACLAGLGTPPDVVRDTARADIDAFDDLLTEQEASPVATPEQKPMIPVWRAMLPALRASAAAGTTLGADDVKRLMQLLDDWSVHSDRLGLDGDALTPQG